jgi:hypothetical protein
MAGLDTIPRQIATFAGFRNSLLAKIRKKPALFDWRTRGKDDFGIMLLEMWAYVCDVLSFYDETIAHEFYLRTARRRPSLRKLVGLLGYIPSPAVAAFTKLALFAEGRQPIKIPAGTAFRSGAFDGEAPQVFEVDNKTVIHPLNNRWELGKIRPSALDAGNPRSLYIDPKTANLKEGELALIRKKSADRETNVCRIDGLSKQRIDGETFTRVEFDRHTLLRSDTELIDVKLLVPKQTASPWSKDQIGNEPLPLDSEHSERLILDGLYRRIKAGQYVVLGKDGHYRWFRVVETEEIMMAITKGEPTIIKTWGIESTITPPPVRVPATSLTLHRDINYTGGKWDINKPAQIVVYYDFFESGKVVSLPKPKIEAGDMASLKLKGSVEAPPEEYEPASFLLEDKNKEGVEVKGKIDFSKASLTIDTQLQQPLVSPVQVFGNVVGATRGERVTGEVLGSGDASLANQSFALKKKPLTYITAPTTGNESGVSSTLNVYVNGIQWEEKTNFYGVSPDAEVYIVRRDDEGNFTVTFGDGERGARLPSGVDNVIADYRFGAGAASPPAGSITQLAKPVKGIKSVKNPAAAAGGADKEEAEDIRTNAPGSALLLGRTVSIIDMEAAALSVPGVRAVQAEWRWHERKQTPVVQIYYIGEASIEEKILERLRSLSEPFTPFSVKRARGIKSHLVIDMEINKRYIVSEVKKNVQAALLGEEDGMLLPENIGIGRPLFRSRIFETVMSIPGVAAVREMLWGRKQNLFTGLAVVSVREMLWGIKQTPFKDFARTPGAGNYFDFETGSIQLGTGEGNHD